MSLWTRNLTFKSNDLGHDATLVLIFDKDIQGIYRDTSQVCWKALEFPAQGQYSANATFQNQIAFVKPEVEGGVIVGASAYTFVGFGQQTTLTKDGNNAYKFSTPAVVMGLPGMKNGCPDSEDVAMGIAGSNPGAPPVPALYFSDVPSKALLNSQFNPDLSAYITSQYREGEIIRGQVSSPVIWNYNLARLRESTTWALTYDPATGQYMLTQE
ncbi:hypothetical protein PAXINDRAFT_172409 [Paxillus involutus ATCC 200175]|uniref:Uncharacterized protein n=1 Tax=Paxillus involutus ATCC 200175 TaxID=664439 RepID=A0A0C9SQL7_PAXIN|nr:hypothetical protein PAXINDRAFT_172409 [Paxillus involutus ATCC 200175]